MSVNVCLVQAHVRASGCPMAVSEQPSACVVIHGLERKKGPRATREEGAEKRDGKCEPV